MKIDPQLLKSLAAIAGRDVVIALVGVRGWLLWVHARGAREGGRAIEGGNELEGAQLRRGPRKKSGVDAHRGKHNGIPSSDR